MSCFYRSCNGTPAEIRYVRHEKYGAPCSWWKGDVQPAGRSAAPNASTIRGLDLWAGDRFRLEGLVNSFLRCRVCGRSGEHECSLVASFSPSSSRHWGFRRRRFDGVLLSHQGSKRWGCVHGHRDPDEAGSCAEAALDRFQSGTSALVEPPWADDAEFDATAAGVRASVPSLGGREFEAFLGVAVDSAASTPNSSKTMLYHSAGVAKTGRETLSLRVLSATNEKVLPQRTSTRAS